MLLVLLSFILLAVESKGIKPFPLERVCKTNKSIVHTLLFQTKFHAPTKNEEKVEIKLFSDDKSRKIIRKTCIRGVFRDLKIKSNVGAVCFNDRLIFWYPDQIPLYKSVVIKGLVYTGEAKSTRIKYPLAIPRESRGAKCPLMDRSSLCKSGFKKNKDGFCSDIDECANGICDGLCINTEGGYVCDTLLRQIPPEQICKKENYIVRLIFLDDRVPKGDALVVLVDKSKAQHYIYNHKCASDRTLYKIDPAKSDFIFNDEKLSCYKNGLRFRYSEDERYTRVYIELKTGTNDRIRFQYTLDTPGVNVSALGNNECVEFNDRKKYLECGSGYRLENGSCSDIDECLAGTANCTDVCVNLPGGYHCCSNGTNYINGSCRSSAIVLKATRRGLIKSTKISSARTPSAPETTTPEVLSNVKKTTTLISTTNAEILVNAPTTLTPTSTANIPTITTPHVHTIKEIVTTIPAISSTIYLPTNITFLGLSLIHI